MVGWVHELEHSIDKQPVILLTDRKSKWEKNFLMLFWRLIYKQPLFKGYFRIKIIIK